MFSYDEKSTPRSDKLLRDILVSLDIETSSKTQKGKNFRSGDEGIKRFVGGRRLASIFMRPSLPGMENANSG